MEGRFEGFAGVAARGWARLPEAHDRPARLRILLDGVPVADLAADRPRDEGPYGFEFHLPRTVLDHRPHSIALRDPDTGQDLPGSPQIFTAAARADAATLDAEAPWVDRDGAEAAMPRRLREGRISYRELKMLLTWRRNGFVVLRAAVDADLAEFCIRHAGALIQAGLPVGYVQGQGAPVPFNRAAAGDFTGGGFLDLHVVSQAVQQAVMQPDALRFLSVLFDEAPVCLRSFLRIRGGEEPEQVDYPAIPSPSAAYLAGAWIALEDVDPEAGPAFLYPGSHRLVPPFDFGGGNVLAPTGHRTAELAAWLRAECARRGIARQPVLLRRGDLCLWHARLAHGAEPPADPAKTRHSLVAQFSAGRVFDWDPKYPGEAPLVRRVNGGIYYDYKPGTYPVGALPLVTEIRLDAGAETPATGISPP